MESGVTLTPGTRSADLWVMARLGMTLMVHHSAPVRAWLAEHREQIAVHYLPSYDPEFNPDERKLICKSKLRWLEYLAQIPTRLHGAAFFFAHGPSRNAR